MPRIAGINIPDEKRIEISLTYIYGIGRPLSNKILKEANISPDKRAKNLTADEVKNLKEIIEKKHKSCWKSRRLNRLYNNPKFKRN